MGRNKAPDFYTPNSVDGLINSIYHAEDAIKYLLNCPQYQKDSKYVTPELLESFSDLASACSELTTAYDYYIKAEFWKATTPEELTTKMAKKLASLIIAKGANPTEAMEKAIRIFSEVQEGDNNG